MELLNCENFEVSTTFFFFFFCSLFATAGQKVEAAVVLACAAKVWIEIRWPDRKVRRQRRPPRRREQTRCRPAPLISRNVVAPLRHKRRRRVDLIALDRVPDLARRVLVEIAKEDVLDLAVDPSVVGAYSARIFFFLSQPHAHFLMPFVILGRFLGDAPSPDRRVRIRDPFAALVIRIVSKGPVEVLQDINILTSRKYIFKKKKKKNSS